MKKNCLVLALFLFISLILLCGAAIAAPLSPKASAPELTYNFKPLPEGTTITHEFVVKNTGKAPLHIIRVKTG